MTTMEAFIKSTEHEIERLTKALDREPNSSETAGTLYGHKAVLRAIETETDLPDIIRRLEEEECLAISRKEAGHNKYYFPQKAYIISKAIVELTNIRE